MPFVFWQQDIYSVAMANLAREKLPVVGGAVGRAFRMIERRMLVRSDAVVVISEDFVPVLAEWRVPRGLVHVIENWAPLDELSVRPRENPWAAENGLTGGTVVLYAGTLGLKHNPELLLEVANRFRGNDDVRVVVVSEGLGAEWLRERRSQHGLGDGDLLLLPYQPYDVLPDVLATGDVLAVILEPEAGVFSVPSKVLSSHCAGRPLLAAIPAENLAARIIEGAGSGLVVDPTGTAAFVGAAEQLVGDGETREIMGKHARAYAERTFDIGTIGDRFERVLQDAVRNAETSSREAGARDRP